MASISKITKVTLTLNLGEILYDIKNKTNLTGIARYDGTNHEASANMRANDDDENINQIMRSITNAYTQMRTKLSEYLDESDGTIDNWMIEPDTAELTIALRLPSNFNHYNYSTLRMALHSYIVNCAIADWFAIFNKADAGDYLNMAAANLSVVREALNKRMRPTRVQPFTENHEPYYTVTPGATTDPMTDVNKDGKLNQDDFVAWIKKYLAAGGVLNSSLISILYEAILGKYSDNSDPNAAAAITANLPTLETAQQQYTTLLATYNNDANKASLEWMTYIENAAATIEAAISEATPTDSSGDCSTIEEATPGE